MQNQTKQVEQEYKVVQAKIAAIYDGLSPQVQEMYRPQLTLDTKNNVIVMKMQYFCRWSRRFTNQVCNSPEECKHRAPLFKTMVKGAFVCGNCTEVIPHGGRMARLFHILPENQNRCPCNSQQQCPWCFLKPWDPKDSKHHTNNVCWAHNLSVTCGSCGTQLEGKDDMRKHFGNPEFWADLCAHHPSHSLGKVPIVEPHICNYCKETTGKIYHPGVWSIDNKKNKKHTCFTCPKPTCGQPLFVPNGSTRNLVLQNHKCMRHQGSSNNKATIQDTTPQQKTLAEFEQKLANLADLEIQLENGKITEAEFSRLLDEIHPPPPPPEPLLQTKTSEPTSVQPLLTRPSSCGPEDATLLTAVPAVALQTTMTPALLTEQSSLGHGTKVQLTAVPAVGPHNDMALLTEQSSVGHGTKVVSPHIHYVDKALEPLVQSLSLTHNVLIHVLS
jgi:hypothetical protein